MTRVAIYDPDPRICGPSTWAQNLRLGFKKLGHECDIVAIAKSGKMKPSWGRVQREKSLSASCSLIPDVVVKPINACALFNTYDFVILCDVKTATVDKIAYNECESPEYLEILEEMNTPWSSALHGKLYFDEDDRDLIEQSDAKTTKRFDILRGAPFLPDLLKLKNFTGTLITHGKEFDQHCARLRATPQTFMPLPYELKVKHARPPLMSGLSTNLGTVGRFIPTKHQHVLTLLLHDTQFKGSYVIRGGCSSGLGPIHSFIVYEDLWKLGYRGERHGQPDTDAESPVGGRKWNYAWNVEKDGLLFEHGGAYQDNVEAVEHIDIQISLTDCIFSGGLFEFSTLESIDAGTTSVISRAFMNDWDEQIQCAIVEHDFKSFTAARYKKYDDKRGLQDKIIGAIQDAREMHSLSVIKHNRAQIKHWHNPARIATAFLETL